ncbi:MotA/TolQ/ExbB proton channel family protein [Alkalinema pantanalense CENA528]|uniref:MotA/TolQ/ExbB proton channel family protein n=1 Tax=Alkalinema pantanalense TaxID=1620705 RepID=UPI003D6F308F
MSSSSVYELISKGGPIMVPIVALSILSFACAFERAWFWLRVFQGEQRIVYQVLDAAKHNLDEAKELAERASHTPIGRFLLAPLNLRQPSPETFRLALESTGEQEFAQMRKGDKLLETVVAVAPLLGLLGTVTGLITTFLNLKIGEGGADVDLSKAAAGIGEALITTAGGMVVAIVALMIFRISITLQAKQVDYFAKVGSDLELIYRQVWYEPFHRDHFPSNEPDSNSVGPQFQAPEPPNPPKPFSSGPSLF